MRRKQSEHSLQIAAAHMLTLVLDPERTWFSSIDHGVGKLGPAEAGIRKRRGVKPGIPDVVVMWAGAHFIGIELKTSKGSLSPAQKELRETWGRLGVLVYTARTLEEVQEILEHCRVPMRRRMNFVGGNNVPAVRSPTIRNRRAPRKREPKNDVPVV